MPFQPINRQAAIDLAQELSHEFLRDAPHSAFLTGSMAAKFNDSASDIDIFLVVDESDLNKLSFPAAETNVSTSHAHFRSMTFPKGSKCHHEITVKAFTRAHVENTLRSDFIIASYIWKSAVCLHDKLNFRPRIAEHLTDFDLACTSLAKSELARARNTLYWLELAPERDYDTLPRMTLLMHFFERIAQSWHLLHREPYPYKKWLFKSARSIGAAYGVFDDMEELLSSGACLSPASSEALRILYADFIARCAGTPVGSVAEHFLYHSTYYYAELDSCLSPQLRKVA